MFSQTTMRTFTIIAYCTLRTVDAFNVSGGFEDSWENETLVDAVVRLHRRIVSGGVVFTQTKTFNRKVVEKPSRASGAFHVDLLLVEVSTKNCTCVYFVEGCRLFRLLSFPDADSRR
jgi:hypothetical protein